MLMLVAGTVGGLGIACILIRKSLLGLMIGLQVLFLGATMISVFAGIASDHRIQGHALGMFVLLGGIGQLAVGLALAIKVFSTRRGISMNSLRSLKQ